jgi:tetratricopeptide (TPR) repeat protein
MVSAYFAVGESIARRNAEAAMEHLNMLLSLSESADEMRASEQRAFQAAWHLFEQGRSRYADGDSAGALHYVGRSLDTLEELLEWLHRAETANASLLWHRADSYAKRSMWDNAAAELRLLIELDPSHISGWCRLSAILLILDDEDGYREHCRHMLQRFGSSQAPDVLEQAVKACSIAPGAVEDNQRLAEMAQRAFDAVDADAPDFAWVALARGLADYRAGNDRDSIKWLHQSLKTSGKTQHLEVTSRLALAMAYSLNETKLARSELAAAQQVMDSSFWKPDAGHLGNEWHDLLICWILRAEAEKVITEPVGKAAVKESAEMPEARVNE